MIGSVAGAPITRKASTPGSPSAGRGFLLLVLGVALAGPAPGLAQEPAGDGAVWASLTPQERKSYVAGDPERASPRSERREAHRAVQGGVLHWGQTCDSAVGGQQTLPATDTNSTDGHADDYVYGAACGGFNASSGVGPDLAYRVTTDLTCDLLAELEPVANDLALWVLTDCDDPVGGCVGGDDSGGNGTAEQVGFTATGGVPYYVVVDGFAGAADDYTLTVSETSQTGCDLFPVELQQFTVE